jgi:hypothetical protein
MAHGVPGNTPGARRARLSRWEAGSRRQRHVTSVAGNRSDAQTQLGNAVPVKLGAVVVRSLLVQLGYLSPRSAEEELMADMRDMRQLTLF